MRLVFIDGGQQREPSRRGLGHLLAIGAVVVLEHHVASFATTLATLRVEPSSAFPTSKK